MSAQSEAKLLLQYARTFSTKRSGCYNIINEMKSLAEQAGTPIEDFCAQHKTSVEELEIFHLQHLAHVAKNCVRFLRRTFESEESLLGGKELAQTAWYRHIQLTTLRKAGGFTFSDLGFSEMENQMWEKILFTEEMVLEEKCEKVVDFDYPHTGGVTSAESKSSIPDSPLTARSLQEMRVSTVTKGFWGKSIVALRQRAEEILEAVMLPRNPVFA